MTSFEAWRGILASASTRRSVLARLGLVAVAFGVRILPADAGDSVYGKIIEVRSADVVVLDYGAGQYVIHIVGIDAPKDEPLAGEAKKFMTDLVLGKNVRMRIESRAENGDLIALLSTDDPAVGVRDVGIELVKSGLAQRQRAYDYKYGELSAAENEAKKSKRGLWLTQPQ